MGFWIEGSITVTYLLFSTFCWSIGHIIFRIFTKCTEDGFFGCGGRDPIALITLVGGSIIYFRLLLRILLFFVKGELPGDKDIMRTFGNMFGGNREMRRKAKHDKN